MRYTRKFLTPLLLLVDMCSYSGYCFPGSGTETGKLLQIADQSSTPVLDGVRTDKMVDTRRVGEAAAVTDTDTGHQAQELKKNYLIQHYLVSFLPYCPNGYQITIEPDVAMPKEALVNGKTGIFSPDTGRYVLCQENGMAKIKVQSGETSGKTTKNVDITYWITKVEALTPLYGRDHSVVNDLVADVEEHEKTKDLMDANCLPRKCPTNQLMAINTKNQMDCASFYICIMGNHFLLHCPADHLFSEEYGVCVDKKYSECHVRAACNHM